ncbi:chalcone isomerase family protein [Shewanella aestuarii]|uniref:Chalcone isomerase domain-containing protein n=1 Tax=Shewanella aestuarii TaxID=1028752 RepID=A0A6G9QLR4_9GAMM|nr:chalcone isomerase family protein [Shewanella aestuarii]QIR15328.1 hypothetical protein HBH39_13210 [Shewanella aestuarii]
MTNLTIQPFFFSAYKPISGLGKLIKLGFSAVLIFASQLGQVYGDQLNTNYQTSTDEAASNIISVAKVDTQSLVKVGEADMDVMWFDVYLAKLYTTDGQYQQNRYPVMLDIEYHRDISAQDLIEATIDQWQAMGLSASEIDNIKTHLSSAWPDVAKGDRLSFVIHNHQLAEFLVNDKPFYQVSDLVFSQAFIDIWLSERTSRPKLRKQLIGEVR